MCYMPCHLQGGQTLVDISRASPRRCFFERVAKAAASPVINVRWPGAVRGNRLRHTVRNTSDMLIFLFDRFLSPRALIDRYAFSTYQVVRILEGTWHGPVVVLLFARRQSLNCRFGFGPCLINRVAGNRDVRRIGTRHPVNDRAVLGQGIQHNVKYGCCFLGLRAAGTAQNHQETAADQTSSHHSLRRQPR